MEPEVPTEAEATSPQLALRRTSSCLLHTASSVLSGGAAVLPSPAEPLEPELAASLSRSDVQEGGGGPSTPLLGHQRRAVRRNQVTERIVEDLLLRFRLRILFFFAAVLILALAMISLFVQIAYAEIVHGNEPCDQPLKKYLLITICVGQVTGNLRQRSSSHAAAFLIGVITTIPHWLVVGWGLYMISACRTCQTTNPDLFYPTKHFIYMQVVFTVLATLFSSVGFTAVYLFVSSIQDRLNPGCRKAVEALPTLERDSPELIDPEDGRVMECPICLETLESNVVSVHTECHHYFHKACLLKWCEHHLFCPLCRATIGDPDEPEA